MCCFLLVDEPIFSFNWLAFLAASGKSLLSFFRVPRVKAVGLLPCVWNNNNG